MRFREERGAALVEMAISILILLLVVFGVIEFGRIMYIRNTLNLAAREGARLAAVTPPPISTANIVTRVRDTSNTVDPGGLSVVTVTTDNPGGLATACTNPTTIGCTVTVNVTYPYTPFVPLLIPSLRNLRLTGRAAMRQEF